MLADRPRQRPEHHSQHGPEPRRTSRRAFLKGAGALAAAAGAARLFGSEQAHAVTREITGNFSGGFTVPPGETWEIRGAVTSNASVIVLGTLVMRAGSSLSITGSSPGAYRGGGTQYNAGDAILRSDVGLWVIDDGVLDASGSPKSSWVRNVSNATGWQAGDDIRSQGGIAFNLTRDVTIRAPHTLLQSTRPSSVNHVRFEGGGVPGVLGRYPLHWHHSQAGGEAVGTVVVGGQNQAFWPHMTANVTLRDTIAINTLGGIWGAAYGWDRADVSDNCLWEHVLAVDTFTADGGSAIPVAQNGDFLLGKGSGNVMRDAVSLRSHLGGGLFWPSQANSQGVTDPGWLVQGFTAIDPEFNGLAGWQNTTAPHVIDGFTVRGAGHNGVWHGAYINHYDHLNGVIDGVEAGIESIATSGQGSGRQEWRNIAIRNAGIGVWFSHHVAQSDEPVLFHNVSFENVGRKVVDTSGTANQSAGTRADFVDCGIGPGDVSVNNPASVIRIQQGANAWLVTASSVQSIAPFFDASQPPSTPSPSTQPPSTPGTSPSPTPSPSPSTSPPPPSSPSPTPSPSPTSARTSPRLRRFRRRRRRLLESWLRETNEAAVQLLRDLFRNAFGGG